MRGPKRRRSVCQAAAGQGKRRGGGIGLEKFGAAGKKRQEKRLAAAWVRAEGAAAVVSGKGVWGRAQRLPINNARVLRHKNTFER